MDAQLAQKEFKENLQKFLENNRKKYLPHPKSNAARIDKKGTINHRKYGNPVQLNADGIKFVNCGSQNSWGTDIKLTAICFIAECVLGRSLHFFKVGVEPNDGDYGNTAFDNIRFVDTQEVCWDDHKNIDFSGLPTVGSLWYRNGFKKVE